MVDLSTSSDQEQMDAVKAWWKENGLSIIGGLILGVGGILGWNYWQTYQSNQRAQASEAFAKAKLDTTQANSFIEAHANSVYGADLGLSQAANLAAKGNYEEAAAFLLPIMQQAPQKIYQQLARIHLAKVYVADGKAQQALDTLEAEEAYGQLTAQSQWAKGDALAALGETAKAKAAYQKARASLKDTQDMAEILTLKINNL